VGARSCGLWSEADEGEDSDAELAARTESDTEEKLAGVVPVPVAAMIDGSAWRRSHSIVWPSDLWPSSRVSWNTRAAQMMGIRMRRPRPSTLLCRSLDGGFLTANACGCWRCGSMIEAFVTPLVLPSDVDMCGCE